MKDDLILQYLSGQSIELEFPGSIPGSALRFFSNGELFLSVYAQGISVFQSNVVFEGASHSLQTTS